MKAKMHKRNLKECEELISRLQKRIWKADEVLREMRMGIYYADKRCEIIHDEMDGMWGHHQDGSDLLVNRSELFNVFQNKLLPSIKKCRELIRKPWLRLKEFDEESWG